MLTGETLAYNTPAEVTRSIVSDTALDPDGPSIGVAADGFVTVFTGYRTNNPDGTGGTGNQYALRSSGAGDGCSSLAHVGRRRGGPIRDRLDRRPRREPRDCGRPHPLRLC